jgi:heme exporter protein C
MREKATYALGILGAIVMIWNLHHIFTQMAPEAAQGMAGWILFIHVPADFMGDILYTIALVTSILFLVKKDFTYDSISVACIEVGTMFILVNFVTGSIWGKNQWGIWWTWDLRLTTQLMKFLLYLGYLVVRPAIAEATQRATMSAFIAIFAYADVPLVMMAIRLPNVRTQHPSPVIETGGINSVAVPFVVGIIAQLLMALALMLVRLHQENTKREIDSLRRELHAL